jgi:hypothetical protein
MGKICAPVRDEKVRELAQAEGVVPVFRGILEVSRIPGDSLFVCTVNLWLSKPLQFSCNWHISKKKYNFCKVTKKTKL